MTLSHPIESGSEHVDGDITTPLSAPTIAGIQLRENTVEVHVHAYWGATLSGLSTQIGHALLDIARGKRVEVVITEVADPHPQYTAADEKTNPPR